MEGHLCAFYPDDVLILKYLNKDIFFNIVILKENIHIYKGNR